MGDIDEGFHIKYMSFNEYTELSLMKKNVLVGEYEIMTNFVLYKIILEVHRIQLD